MEVLMLVTVIVESNDTVGHHSIDIKHDQFDPLGAFQKVFRDFR
jgi:hypothetical protein